MLTLQLFVILPASRQLFDLLLPCRVEAEHTEIQAPDVKAVANLVERGIPDQLCEIILILLGVHDILVEVEQRERGGAVRSASVANLHLGQHWDFIDINYNSTGDYKDISRGEVCTGNEQHQNHNANTLFWLGLAD